MILAFPQPDATSPNVTQNRLLDLRKRIEEWEFLSQRINELSQQIISDLAGGARIEPGQLRVRLVRTGTGPETITRLVIE